MHSIDFDGFDCTIIKKIILKTERYGFNKQRVISLQVHVGVWKGHVKVLSVFYYLLSQEASPPNPPSTEPLQLSAPPCQH